METQIRLPLILSIILVIGAYALICTYNGGLTSLSDLKSYDIRMLIEMCIAGILFGLIYPFSKKQINS
jgi:hypothetical protein